MKKLVPSAICVITLAILAIGCSKTKSKTGLEAFGISIEGKWSLVVDSTWSGIGPISTLSVHKGTPLDYWDFRTDGRVYVQEGVKRDTLGYEMNSQTAITIGQFGWILNGQQSISTIRVLTAHKAVIKSNTLATPGGVYIRTLYLER